MNRKMNHKRKIVLGMAFLAAFSAGAMQVRAQQEQDTGEKPKPAGRVYLPLPDLNAQQDSQADLSSSDLQPDIRPLTGMETATLGTPRMLHSYWVPGLEYGNAGASDSPNLAANSGWNSTNYFAGNMSLLEAWGHSLIGVNYSGGGFVSSDGSLGNGQFHQLSTAYHLDLRRWQWVFLEQFSYLPESGFGFGATTALAIPGVGGSLGASLPSLQGGYVPNQSILSATGPRYSNVSGAQLTYLLSPRSAITAGAAYGILRFINGNSLDDDHSIFSAGYSYQITKHDSIGVLYRFTSFQYLANPQAVGDHAAQLAYGRKVTGRLSVQLFGGPEYSSVRVPNSGLRSRTVGSGGASLLYGTPHGELTVSYMSGVTGGSGIFTGAVSNVVSANLGHSLTRVWQGGVDCGYARSSALLNAAGQTSVHYNSWYAGAGVSRPFGRDVHLSLGYRAQIEQANQAVCSGPSCGDRYLQHSIWLSFQWHSRPLVIE